MTENKQIVLIDSSVDSLTISWPETTPGPPYILQYRQLDEAESFQTLSDSLTTPQARKRNLTGDSGFVFRAKSKNDTTNSSWTIHTEPFYLLTKEEETQRMEAPSVCLGGSHSSLLIAWKKHGATTTTSLPDATATYELQMRESRPEVPWQTIANGLSGTQVRKKSLTSQSGYQFRVRPCISTAVPGRMSVHSSTPHGVFSPPSETMVALGLSTGIQQWFQNCGDLVRPDPPRQKLATSTVADALGGKEFILLYASAHWCGPCRQFTPRLVQWYREQQQERLVEVVFLSADHDKDSFTLYFQGMPWLAVDYDDDAREQLMAQIRVTGIPRLVVLDGRTGKIVVDNAVGRTLDVSHWRKLLGGH